MQYIIGADELAAYRELKTGDARDNFIAALWARLDPTPGTAANEFRDEFLRRIDYANAHFTDTAAHSGMDSDRGRIYVMFGAPNNVTPWNTGAYEIWQYQAGSAFGTAFRIEFSVPPIESCDGSYRIRSPAPAASFKAASISVQVYPGRFITVSIPVDFSRAVSVSWMLRTRAGEPVLENEAPILDGELGPPENNEPLSLHLLGCRMFGTGGMAFTHPVPAGPYTFSTSITLTNGETHKESVAFEVN